MSIFRAVLRGVLLSETFIAGERIICGIDPGLGVTGYAVIAQRLGASRVLDAGVLRMDASLPLEVRLVQLSQDVNAVLEEHTPAAVAVEQLYAHYKHPRTAILMGHARGVILAAAGRMDIAVESYNATRVKRFLTGNGRASKAQMQKAIQITLGLAVLPEPDDVADALALALCCGADQRAASDMRAAP